MAEHSVTDQKPHTVPTGAATFQPPTAAELVDLAARDDIELTEGEASELVEVVARLVEAAGRALDVPGDLPIARPAGRAPGNVPAPDENPHNAFTRRGEISGAPVIDVSEAS